MQPAAWTPLCVFNGDDPDRRWLDDVDDRLREFDTTRRRTLGRPGHAGAARGISVIHAIASSIKPG
jgi:hypothetical protein